MTQHRTGYEPSLRLAVLGFPGDHFFGGGLTLLSKLGPVIKERGGCMAWVGIFYGEDAAQLSRWKSEGVTPIDLYKPLRWYRRWLGQSPTNACEEQLRAFQPNVVIVAVGGDRIYSPVDWLANERLTAIAKAQGAKIVIMHQLSEAGQWVEPGEMNNRWLDWQRAADWHQFVSEATRRETEMNFGFSLPGEVIRNNYKVPFNQPPPWPGESSVLKMAFVGRFRVFQKGLDLLLEAAGDPRLRSRADWHISLIGGGLMEERLRAEIARRGLTGKMTVSGHTPDITGVWRTHHLLVMPSRSEGLSLALCEAMLCERPAIATLAGGSGDLLVDEETGFHTYPDASHLAQTIERALDVFHSGGLQSLGQAAGQRARSQFPENPESVYVDQLESLLRA